MKLSHRNYPGLRMLDEGKLGKIAVYQADAAIISNEDIVSSMTSLFKSNFERYKTSIRWISEPFNEAIRKSMSSLIRDDVWNNIGTECGTILNFRLPFIKDEITVFYSVEGTGRVDINGCGIHNCIIYYFVKDIFLGMRVQNNSDGFNALFSNTVLPDFNLWKQANSNLLPNVDIDMNEVDNFIYSLVIAYINFTKYAQVETKYLKPKQRIKDIACKYTNDTNSNIEILNSTWFTNLVKSDAFGVRGHFRLQACGEGRKDRKLIWINEFQKEGYTAKARMLTA